MIAAMAIAGCGYHLRGAFELPKELKTMALQGDSPSLHEQFTRIVQSSGGVLADSPQKAGLLIKIYDEQMQRRTLSLSSRGRANQFELHYHLKYEIAKGDAALLTPQPLDIRREYFNDQQDIIAKDIEEGVIRKEMHQQAVRTILNRMRMALEATVK
jgi:LPS-assembly lipoprotein